ncbi:hypothetical protein MASR1M32_05770 [Rhodobacter sp.]
MEGRFRADLRWSDVTPQREFLSRRALLAGVAGLVASPVWAKIAAQPSAYSTDEPVNTLEDITGYNNFYEFGTGKGDPAAYSGASSPIPGRWRSTAWWTGRAAMIWPMWRRTSRWRSASTGCAVSRPGAW